MRTSIARLIAALVAAALPIVLMPAPAQAATITIVSRSGRTAGSPAVQMTSFDCSFPFTSVALSTYTLDRAVGPGTAPLGTGSLRINQLHTGLVSGVAFENRSLTRLASTSGRLRGWFRSDLPAKVRGVLRVTLADESTWIGEAVVRTLAADTWQLADGLAPPYLWVEQGAGNGVESRTLASFRGAHGPGTVDGYLGAFVRSSDPDPLACNPFYATTVYVDNFRVSKGTDTQVFNFEPLLVTSASISVTRKTITNGGSTTFATTLRSGSKVLPGRSMVLLSKPYGAQAYSQVGTAVTTNSSGVARKTVSPARNTTYKWHFDGDKNYRLAESYLEYIGVRARVSLTLADSTLHPGQTLVATGWITPAKVDSVATLWRKTSSGRVKLGSITLTEPDGTYRITKVLSSGGTYKVYVTVPAAKGNLGGTSPIRTATVS
jgi:hypothetical protein